MAFRRSPVRSWLAPLEGPPEVGGLGFTHKWNLGWMNDTLRYMSRDPVHRKFHHSDLTFGLLYAFQENFILPLGHDEVVHGKGALLNKMPGDRWRQFANLRAYYAFMFTHPGKKLLFMGDEFGQTVEWNHDAELDWPLLQEPGHRGVFALLRDLNALYRDRPELLAWTQRLGPPPRRAFVVHGESDRLTGMAELLKGAGVPDVAIPSLGQSFEL